MNANIGPYLVGKLPHIQVKLSVYVHRLRRLAACGARHLEAVRQMLLPLHASLHPGSRPL